jgi:hypothetical protein
MKGLAVAALLLLGAGVCPGHGGQAPPRLETVLDEMVGVGPGKIRTLDLPLDEPGVRVIVQFDVVQGLTGVRVLLMSIEDAERWFAGRDHSVLAGSSFGFSGSLTRTLPEKGEYRLVLDNLGESRAEARVRLRVRLLRNGASALPYGPEGWRAQTLVWITAGLFLAILGIAGLRLKRAFEERQDRLRAGYL